MKIVRAETAGIRLEIVAPPRDLAPYITAFYRTEVLAGHPIEDWLPPEGANLRVGMGEVYEASIGDAPLQRVPAAVLSGPTSQVTRLRVAAGRFWGVGLLPLGWARFTGLAADHHADRFCDTTALTALEPLSGVIDHLAIRAGDMDRDLKVMTAGFRALLVQPLPQQDAIQRAHAAILSDGFATVAALADHLEMNPRTFERFARRHFGFAPKRLLRRQRFLRSLARFMADPSMKWIHSLDSHYHDQAQFVREFKHFMMMLPGTYAALDHPITLTAVRARRMALGDAMQMLHRPKPLAPGLERV